MEFSASKGITVQIITTGVIALFAFIGHIHVSALIHSNGNITSVLTHSGLLIFLIALIVFCFVFAPQKYSTTDKDLIIHRPASNKIIPLKSITEIKAIEKSDLKGIIRTFGVAGLFGNYGKFHTSNLGNITMYGTQSKNYILIITNNKKVVITPDSLEIIEQIKAVL